MQRKICTEANEILQTKHSSITSMSIKLLSVFCRFPVISKGEEFIYGYKRLYFGLTGQGFF